MISRCLNLQSGSSFRILCLMRTSISGTHKATSRLLRPSGGTVCSPIVGRRCSLAPWASQPRGSVAPEAIGAGGWNILTASGAMYGGEVGGVAQPANPPNPAGPPVPGCVVVREMFMWPPHKPRASLGIRTPRLETRALDRVALCPRAALRPRLAVVITGAREWALGGMSGRLVVQRADPTVPGPQTWCVQRDVPCYVGSQGSVRGEGRAGLCGPRSRDR